jgi:imidazolonepropionase-like amidohydrolase
LPEGEIVDLYADGDRWTHEPVRRAELIGEGWLLPGLVDAHTHPGMEEEPGSPFDEQLLRHDLHHHVAAGVTMIRSPGLAGDPPEWFGRDPDVPRAVHAGPWIALHGEFFDGWGQRVDLASLPGVAAEQASRTGWTKLILDWGPDDPPITLDVLEDVVAKVHAVGGRVAVHSQQAAGGAIAVAAGVDSLEHGMCLAPDLLSQMAEQGIALTPTLMAITAAIPELRQSARRPGRQWYLKGAEAHPALSAAAFEAGVTVLAGTDERPHGRVADEIRALVAAGLPPEGALGAGSWVARRYLGLPGLAENAPADVVVYDQDPRADLDQLDRPAAVVLRGRLACRRP